MPLVKAGATVCTWDYAYLYIRMVGVVCLGEALCQTGSREWPVAVYRAIHAEPFAVAEYFEFSTTGVQWFCF